MVSLVKKWKSCPYKVIKLKVQKALCTIVPNWKFHWRRSWKMHYCNCEYFDEIRLRCNLILWADLSESEADPPLWEPIFSLLSNIHIVSCLLKKRLVLRSNDLLNNDCRHCRYIQGRHTRHHWVQRQKCILFIKLSWSLSNCSGRFTVATCAGIFEWHFAIFFAVSSLFDQIMPHSPNDVERLDHNRLEWSFKQVKILNDVNARLFCFFSR